VTDIRNDTGRDARVHRALASPVRHRILSVLRGDPEPQGVHALAEQLGLHSNTVRAHLAILEDAGLAASQREGRDRPGRPRLVYRATPQAAEAGEVDAQRGRGYRFLAQILSSFLAASVPDPGAAAREAGTAWGRFLVERPGPFQKVEAAVATGHLVTLLDELGFAPQLDEADASAPRVLLRHCPFLDVAKEHQDVVCNIHLGLMRGALEELGGEVEARDLLPFVAPNLCVSHLQVPA
jgi:predicted ArsR family transcriptional regulator